MNSLQRCIARAALASLCLTVGAAPRVSAAPGSDARAFVASLYAAFRQPAGANPPPDQAARTYTPELLALMHQDAVDANGEVGALDGDPLCACQDFDISHVAIRMSAVTATTARAAVRFANLGRRQLVTLDLARVDGHWRVADVHEVDMPSLVAFLKQAHAQAVAESASAPR